MKEYRKFQKIILYNNYIEYLLSLKILLYFSRNKQYIQNILIYQFKNLNLNLKESFEKKTNSSN